MYQTKGTMELKRLNADDYDWVLVWKRGDATTQIPSPPDDRPLSTKAIVLRALKGIVSFGVKKFLGF